MRFAQAVATAIVLLASASAGAGPAPPRPFLVSPRMVLELPDAPTKEDVAEGGRFLHAVEQVARHVDADLVAAGALDPKKTPGAADDAKFDKEPVALSALKAPPKDRWRAVMTRDRDAMVAIIEPLVAKVNTQGTCFYSNGADAVLAYVPVPDRDLFRKEVLDWTPRMVLYHRLGLWYRRAAEPAGACIPFGFHSFLRWSHLPADGSMPAAPGGIDDATLAKLQKQLRDGVFPSLADLFAARPKDFDDETRKWTLYGASAVLAEFLTCRTPKAKSEWYALLAKYAASSRPMQEFKLATLLEHYRKPIGDAAAIEKELRTWLLEKSRPLNAEKAAAAAAAPK